MHNHVGNSNKTTKTDHALIQACIQQCRKETRAIKYSMIKIDVNFMI